jgi:cell wall assembly regulator SMI1
MDTIDKLWSRIEAGLRQTKPLTGLRLGAGASEADIDQLEGTLGDVLPPDFHQSYLRHDGGYSMEMVSTMEILPLREIIDWWQILEQLLHDEDWARQPPYYFTEEVVRSGWQVGPVQSVWWHRRWIPFASDVTGNLACLDLAPAAGGTVGQILDWDHECGPSKVLFSGFHYLLDGLAVQVESDTDKQDE